MTAYACLPQYPYSPFSDVVVEPPSEFLQRSEREARVHLREVEMAGRRVGVTVDSRTSVHPAPYLGIIEAAEQGGCDVIFMASHGRPRSGQLADRQRNATGAHAYEDSGDRVSLKSKPAKKRAGGEAGARCVRRTMRCADFFSTAAAISPKLRCEIRSSALFTLARRRPCSSL